jgi:hypothetical protein
MSSARAYASSTRIRLETTPWMPVEFGAGVRFEHARVPGT